MLPGAATKPRGAARDEFCGLEDGYPVRAADMPGTDDLGMRVYADMAQKERELISELTRAALS